VVSKLRVGGAKSEGEENMYVGLKSRLTEPSEVDQPKTSCITPSQVVPMAKCDGRKHNYKIIKISPTSQTLHSAQCDIDAGNT
jgi:hypothetical protein